MAQHIISPVVFFDDPSEIIDGIHDMRALVGRESVEAQQGPVPPWQQTTPVEPELEAKLDEHPELVERLKAGDTTALTEILEVAGARVGTVTVTEVKASKKLPPA